MNNSLIDDIQDYSLGYIKMTRKLREHMIDALIAIDNALYDQEEDMIETITEILRVPRA